MKSRTKAAEQRTLLNFDIADPFAAHSVDTFKEQYRRLNGRNPSAKELSSYYDQHPNELARRRGAPSK